MRFDVMTLFPDLINTVCGESIIGRAAQAGILSVHAHNIRDYSKDKHRRVDDTPYGGGMGMVMRPDPIVDCFRAVEKQTEGMKRRVIYMSPQGSLLTQKKAAEYLAYDNIVLLCGHYEGVDQRAIDAIVDEEVSIGDYVLTGGELPACIFIDCVSRLLEGTLASAECYEEESISCGMLEYPQYTRPVDFEGARVPDVLLGGNHSEIAKWRYRAALEKTIQCRPDLL